MRLLYLRYSQGKETKYGLFAVLHKTNTEYHVLKTDQLGPRGVAIIRSNFTRLSKLEPQERYAWLKERHPELLKGYRKLPTGSVTELSDYSDKLKK